MTETLWGSGWKTDLSLTRRWTWKGRRPLWHGPLVVSLAETGEVLYTVNWPPNRASHEGLAEWIDRAVGLAREAGFRRTRVRGDTDFALTVAVGGGCPPPCRHGHAGSYRLVALSPPGSPCASRLPT